jgi:hypothetical protein
MRPRHLAAFACAMFTSLLIVSCPSPSGPSDDIDDGSDDGSSAFIGEEWWGSWGDGGERWHFTDRALTITLNAANEFATVKYPTIRKQTSTGTTGEFRVTGIIHSSWEEETYIVDLLTPSIMRVTNYTNSNVLFQKYYLMRDGDLQEPFTGRVLTNAASASRSFGAMEGGESRALQTATGVSLTIQNALNASVPLYAAAVGAGGDFKSQEFIPGDEYRITASAAVGKPFSLSIVPSDGGLDIGNLIVSEAGYNLKCGIELTGIRSSLNSKTRSWIGFPYPGQWYDGSIIIQKIGDAAGPALDWSLESPDGDLSVSTALSGHLDGIAASAEAYAAIPISLRTDSTSLADFVDRRLSVTITDAGGLSWDDQISLRFYNDRIFLELDGTGSAIIVTPEGQSIGLNTGIALPYREDGYFIWLLPITEAESQFSIGVNREALVSDPQVDSSSAIDREHAIDIAYGDAIRSARPAGSSRWFHLTPTASSTYVRDFERTVVQTETSYEVSSVAIALGPGSSPLVAYCINNKVNIAELEGETWNLTTPSGGFPVGVSSPELSIAFDGSGAPVVAGRSGSSWDGVVVAWRRGGSGSWVQYSTEYSSSDLCLTPSVATDDSGQSLLVWMGGEGIKTARIPSSDTPLSPETLNVRSYYAATGGIIIGRPFTIFDSLGMVFLFKGTITEGIYFFSVRPGEAPLAMANTRYNEVEELAEIFEGRDGVIRALRTTGISTLKPDGRGFYEDTASKTSYSAPYGASSARAVANEAGTVHVVYATSTSSSVDKPEWLRYARGSGGTWLSQVVDYSEKAVINASTGKPHKMHAIAAGPNPSGDGEVVWIAYWIYRSGLMVARLEIGTR